ncbi:hypothetical protein LAV82_23475 [Bacillus sp. ILBB4]|nr:hypothetical protein [Bacillus sp. ILBB4]
MTANPKLYEAFAEEAQDINVQDLMAQMLENYNQEKGYVPTPADEIRIRKMMIAMKFLEEERNHLAMLKQAIMDEWDTRIKAKSKDIDGIKEFIEKYIKDANQGKKLSLDVGTATLRRNPPKVKVTDTEKAVEFLKQHNMFEQFAKAPVLDTTLLQNSYINDFNKQVATETERRVAVEKEEKGKITKKREGEIKLEVEREWADQYYGQLPEFMKYEPENQKVSITMK